MTDRTVLVTVPSEGTSSTVQRAQPGANRDVRTMAPSKRRKMSTSSQMGHVQRTVRTVSVQCDLSAPDADLDAEPEELMCPITHAMFRDPVMVVESGHTYERSAILEHFEQRNEAKDPLTRRALSSTKVMTNWAVRQIVQAWLDKHPSVTPDGWDSRELLEPSKDDGTRHRREGDVGVLRTWRAMCPALQERWPEAARPEQWRGVTMDDGRVVKLLLDDFGLTGAVPAEIGRLSALRVLDLANNQLTSVPAEIGQLTSLTKLALGRNQLTSVPAEIGQLTSLDGVVTLGRNQLTSVPAEIGQLTSLTVLYLRRQSADERAGGDLAAHVADAVVPQRQQADERAGGDRAAHVARAVVARLQQADERAGGDRAAHLADGVETQRQQADESARCDTRAQSGRLLRAAGCRRDTFVACNTTFTAFTAKHSSKKTFTNNNGRVDTYPTVSPHGEPASRPR